jgi:hypothetical protein
MSIQTEAASTRRFYRAVRTDPPTLLDFTSNTGKGRPLPKSATLDAARLWSGFSCYNTESQARRQARGVPILGDDIAELVSAADDPVQFERTLDAGH